LVCYKIRGAKKRQNEWDRRKKDLLAGEAQRIGEIQSVFSKIKNTQKGEIK